MKARAQQLASNPAMQALLKDPSRLDALMSADPALRQMLQASPDLLEMVKQPERMQQVLSSALDPSGPAASLMNGDLSQQRMVSSRLAACQGTCPSPLPLPAARRPSCSSRATPSRRSKLPCLSTLAPAMRVGRGPG